VNIGSASTGYTEFKAQISGASISTQSEAMSIMTMRAIMTMMTTITVTAEVEVTTKTKTTDKHYVEKQ
jgi:hypothetical protein